MEKKEKVGEKPSLMTIELSLVVKNPSNWRLEFFINLGILRIAVIEVPIIEDLLYFWICGLVLEKIAELFTLQDH